MVLEDEPPEEPLEEVLKMLGLVSVKVNGLKPSVTKVILPFSSAVALYRFLSLWLM